MAAESQKKKKGDGKRALATNPQASRLYELNDRYEAGLVLLGSEVKAIREGKMTLRDAYVSLKGDQAFLRNSHIGPYSHQGYSTHEERRDRKLLLHRREIDKLRGKLVLRGFTLIPLKVYLVRGRIKLEMALAVGKKLHDKRDAKRRAEAEREMERR